MHTVIKKLYEEYKEAYKEYLDAVESEYLVSGVFVTGGMYEKHRLEYLHNALQDIWSFEKANNRIVVEIGS